MFGSWVKPVRTALQTFIATIVLLPFLVEALGMDTAAGVGAALAGFAAAASRVMAIPMVEDFLSRLGLASPGHGDSE